MPKAAEKPVEKVSSDGDFHEVKRGDTLSKIAGATKPEGVTLDQMLVGLLRANQGAFDGGNMNRLKSGKILAIPDRAALESVTPTEAKKVVMAQSADWNAYRGRLAGVAASSPAREDSARQQTTGKITARVEEAADASAAKVLGTELATRAYRLLMEVLGTAATVRTGSPGAVLRGRIERMHRACLILTFGGGTNEIQRDIIGMVALGLPRVNR